MNTRNAFAQFFSSERVVGALLLLVVLGIALAFPAAFADHQQELINILAAFVIQFVGWHTYVKVSAGELVLVNQEVNPLIEPLQKLWRSRKFMTTLIGLLLELLVVYLHLPEELRAQLMVLILGVVTYFNGAVAVEDAQFNRRFQRAKSPI